MSTPELFDTLPQLQKPQRSIVQALMADETGPVAAERLFVKVVVDGVPVAKGRPRLGRMANGQPIAFTPAHTRTYETLVRQIAQQSVKGHNPLEGQLIVRVSVYLPIPTSFSKKKREDALMGVLHPVTRPDIDNYVKSAMDALNTVVFRDDSQITDLVARKRYSEKPRLEIEVFI